MRTRDFLHRFVGACAGIVLGILSLALPAQAASPIDFKGKTITMIIGFGAGGGTDAVGRLVVPYLEKSLPGKPTIIVRYMPGASGMTSFNYLIRQTAPDGLTFTIGTNDQVDPVNYRKAQVQYDPTKLEYVGGFGRGGFALLVNRDAEARLYDKSAKPLVMGSVGGWPRAATQVTAWGIEFLGWNARWVTGYRGTKDLFIALERGEIDMTATANSSEIESAIGSGKFRVLNQSGSLENGKFVGRTDLHGAPLVPDIMANKIADPLAQKAFEYWKNITATDKFLALAPGTPGPVVTAYREAFREMVGEPDFMERGRKISDYFTIMTHDDVEILVNALAATPPEVVDYLTAMLGRQGVAVGK
jgi:tripartite-type tricarboxylate transporter receptor subunit TctC